MAKSTKPTKFGDMEQNSRKEENQENELRDNSKLKRVNLLPLLALVVVLVLAISIIWMLPRVVNNSQRVTELDRIKSPESATSGAIITSDPGTLNTYKPDLYPFLFSIYQIDSAKIQLENDLLNKNQEIQSLKEKISRNEIEIRRRNENKSNLIFLNVGFVLLGCILGVVVLRIIQNIVEKKHKKEMQQQLRERKTVALYQLILNLGESIDNTKNETDIRRILSDIISECDNVSYLKTTEGIPKWKMLIETLHKHRMAPYLSWNLTIKSDINEVAKQLRIYLDNTFEQWEDQLRTQPIIVNPEKMPESVWIKPTDSETKSDLSAGNKINEVNVVSQQIEKIKADYEQEKNDLYRQIQNWEANYNTLKRNSDDQKIQIENRNKDDIEYYKKEIKLLDNKNTELETKNVATLSQISKLVDDNRKSELLISELNDRIEEMYVDIENGKKKANSQNDLNTIIDGLDRGIEGLPVEFREIIKKIKEVDLFIESDDMEKLKSREGLRLLDDSVFRNLPAKSLINDDDVPEYLLHALGFHQSLLAGKLTRMGLKVLNPMLGTDYNSEQQQSDYTTDTIRTADVAKHNTIERVLKLGYAWEDRTAGRLEILRPARVVRFMKMEGTN